MTQADTGILVVNGSYLMKDTEYMVEVQVSSAGRNTVFQQLFTPVESNIQLDVK